ncbi:MAG: hypothetical protein NC453_13850 [Muribaculum sp.]|nr:hypothetical protein [Muribaculum sp.]
MKLLQYAPLILLMGLFSCSDEPEQTDDLPIQPLVQSVCEYDNNGFNAPEDPPEYYIVNSARDLANLPEGTLAPTTDFTYTRVDFAKKTLVIVTSVIFCKPKLDDDDFNWAMADYILTKDYNLNIRYSNCSVMPYVGYYSEKCKIQFGFTTDKIPSDTKIVITESMVTTNQ